MAKKSQKPKELAFMLEFLRGKNSFLEIGSRYGETIHAAYDVLAPGARILAIDLPGGAWGRDDSFETLVSVLDDGSQRGFQINSLMCDSKLNIAFETAKQLGPFDVIFIDGDHTYEGVRNDFLIYKDLSDVIIFHDIAADQVKNGQGQIMGVSKFWEELKFEYPDNLFNEYVEHDDSPLMGVGVFFK